MVEFSSVVLWVPLLRAWHPFLVKCILLRVIYRLVMDIFFLHQNIEEVPRSLLGCRDGT